MDLYAYARAIRRSWVVVLTCVVAGVAGSFAVLATTAPIYASHVTFFAATSSAGDSNPLEGDEFGQQRVNTYVQLLSSSRLADRVVGNSDLGLSARQVMSKIDGAGDLNTVLFTATIRDTSASRSLEIAQAVTREFPLLVQEIESQGTSVESPSPPLEQSPETDTGDASYAPIRLDVVSGPSTDSAAVSPNRKLILFTGLLAGLILGATLAILRALADNTIRRLEDIVTETDVPVLGSFPHQPSAQRVEDAEALPGWHGESLRALRTSLRFMDVGAPVTVLVVTSPSGGEGKSTTAAGLAAACAEAGDKVLLMEADLRRPRVASYLGLDNSVGLTNVLVGDVTVNEVIQSWGANKLDVLPSGTLPPNPSELLGSPAMDALLKTLRQQYDIVVIDTSSVLPVTDAVVLATWADGVLVVARHGKSRRADVRQAVDMLRSVDVRVLGTVRNWVPAGRSDSDVLGSRTRAS